MIFTIFFLTEEGSAFTYNRTSETMELTSNKVSRSKLRNSLPDLTNRQTRQGLTQEWKNTRRIMQRQHLNLTSATVWFDLILSEPFCAPSLYLKRKALCRSLSSLQYLFAGSSLQLSCKSVDKSDFTFLVLQMKCLRSSTTLVANTVTVKDGYLPN